MLQETASLHDVCMVVDTAELFMLTSSEPMRHTLTWSVYKHHHTLKALIGMRQDGTVCFVSDCYSGKISDSLLTEASKLADFLPKNSVVMSRGRFHAQAPLAEAGITLLSPPASMGRGYFATPEERQFARDAGSVRTHMGHVLHEARQYRMLVHEVPASMAEVYNTICRTVFFLINITGVLVHPE